MGRVFVIEPQRKVDVSAAEQFGDIVYLFDNGGYGSVWGEAFSPSVLRSLRANSFDASQDCVLVVGSMVLVAQMIAAIVIEYGQVNLLLFSAAHQMYVKRSISK